MGVKGLRELWCFLEVGKIFSLGTCWVGVFSPNSHDAAVEHYAMKLSPEWSFDWLNLIACLIDWFIWLTAINGARECDGLEISDCVLREKGKTFLTYLFSLLYLFVCFSWRILWAGWQCSFFLLSIWWSSVPYELKKELAASSETSPRSQRFILLTAFCLTCFTVHVPSPHDIFSCRLQHLWTFPYIPANFQKLKGEQCKCPLPCGATSFRPLLSYAAFPSDEYIKRSQELYADYGHNSSEATLEFLQEYMRFVSLMNPGK